MIQDLKNENNKHPNQLFWASAPLEVANKVQLSHRAPKLPALANSRLQLPSAGSALMLLKGGPLNWIRTWRGFQEDESVNIMELSRTALSYCKSSKNHLISKRTLLSLFLSCSVSSDPTAKSVSLFPL